MSDTTAIVQLACGCAVIFFAAYCLYAGKAWTRFHGWVYRDQEPGTFWWQVIWLVIFGIFMFALAIRGTAPPPAEQIVIIR
jgi:H+/Cl- antiporter ClcA